MPNPLDLQNTLFETRDILHALRRVLAVRGHTAAMQGIDTLVSVAEDETIRAIAAVTLGAAKLLAVGKSSA